MSIAESALRTIDDCWNRIGVNGDQSCPELATHVHCRNCPVFASAARLIFDRPPPPGYLDDWGGILAQPVAVADPDEVGLLVFRLGEEWLALGSRLVAEVTTVRPVHRVPHRSNHILSGIVNLRGQLKLCVSLHGLLGVEPAAAGRDGAARTRLVVISRDGESWVFAADEVAGVQRIPRRHLQKVPSTLANPSGSYSQAVFAWGDDRSVALLDDPRVFAALRSLGQ
ncbi:chemotaxis protein CheW (plasmid) [Tundrisphaera sp. TA3]|uniref:chemotaxis protein CheW n=1 Tax=Tundrisphaera sp. TA3 TaxID=3435775 RepID=UPI003EB9B0EB